MQLLDFLGRWLLLGRKKGDKRWVMYPGQRLEYLHKEMREGSGSCRSCALAQDVDQSGRLKQQIRVEITLSIFFTLRFCAQGQFDKK